MKQQGCILKSFSPSRPMHESDQGTMFNAYHAKAFQPPQLPNAARKDPKAIWDDSEVTDAVDDDIDDGRAVPECVPCRVVLRPVSRLISQAQALLHLLSINKGQLALMA
jgi:hypothetical protein